MFLPRLPTARWSLAVALTLAMESAWGQAETAKVTLEAEDALTCPTPGQLLEALRQRFGEDLVERGQAVAAGSRLTVHSSTPAQLEVVLFKDDVPLQRRTVQGTPDECSQLAQTVVFLVDAWLREAPLRATELASPGAASVATEPPAVPIRTAPKPRSTGAPPSPAKPPAAGAAPAPALEAAAEPTPPAALPEFPPPAPESLPSRWTFEPSVAGGAFVDALAEQAGFRGLVTLEGAYRSRLRVGVHVLLETPVSAAITPGTLSAHSQTAVAVLSFSPFASETMGLDLLAGGGVEMLTARGEGFSEDGSQTVYQPALVGGLRWRQRLWGPVFGVAVLEARGRLHRQLIGADGLGDTLRLAPVCPSLALGLTWVLD